MVYSITTHAEVTGQITLSLLLGKFIFVRVSEMVDLAGVVVPQDLCMQVIVKPLESAGHKGIILVSGDGAVRKYFPILATYVGDYPEQVLVSLAKISNCPNCPAPHDEIDK